MTREAPYNRLKRIAGQWIADNVLYRHRETMWVLDLENKNYNISELRHKIETAKVLGYVVELSTNDEGHVVFSYVKMIPAMLPRELR